MKHYFLSIFLLSSLVGWGQCQVVVTPDEGVVVEWSDNWRNPSLKSTVQLNKGDVCEIETVETTPDGEVLYFIHFVDVNDERKIKIGVVVNPVDGWYHKIEEDCDLNMIITVH